jgi:uncharacterized membrane protein YgdD (TMEM256/DUF423 family)
MHRIWLLFAAVSGFLGVGMGAFGAHALKNRLAAPMMAAYQTGVQYHLLHTAVLVAVAVLASRGDTSVALRLAGWGFFAGIVLFSGSLYAMSLSNVRALGAITPIGGGAWLVAWAALGVWAYTAPQGP